MKLLKTVSVVTAVFAFALVALSPIVRITGSGMGCGDDWPLCNGSIFPPLDNPQVMIEWGHRLAAAGVSVLIAASGVLAVRMRARPEVGGPGGVLRPTALAAALLVSQIFLGAVTVRLELPAWIVVLHMANAFALLAAILIATFRAFATRRPVESPSPRARRRALWAAGLGAGALLLGALTANLNAGMACGGFPLCSGSIWPAGGGLAHVHWAHRLVAYALFLLLIGMAVAPGRRAEPARVRRAGWVALGVLLVHVAVAAAMVVRSLPMTLRAAHAAVGALLWIALVYLVWESAPRAAREVDPGRR